MMEGIFLAFDMAGLWSTTKDELWENAKVSHMNVLVLSPFHSK
jgi:hypothetical protein